MSPTLCTSTIPVYTPEQLEALKYMSYSFNETLYICPRRFELDKLASRRSNNFDFAFGHAVGAGTQKMMETGGDLTASIWEAFLFWDLELDDGSGAAKKKTFWFACAAVDSFSLLMNGPLKDWEVAVFNGKPAAELSFRVDLGDGFGYFGHVDSALRNKTTGSLGVFEGKTTGLTNIDEAMWKNSNQSVGYSLILDTIAEQMGLPEGNRYDVFYPVYKCGSMSWELLSFAKTYLMRADFIKSLLMDKEIISMYIAHGKFPKRGSGCYNFFRRCQHFDVCDMSNKMLLPKDGTVDRSEGVYGGLDEEHDFHFTLEQIIDAQIRRVSNSLGE